MIRHDINLDYIRWNDKSTKPFLMLHGWQDNAGTFDRLIPLLPKQFSYLAIDLPGHGLSSQIPNGMQYHTIDKLHTINYILKEYNWDRISLIGHSLGSIVSFMFTSVFPSKVDFIVGIDALKPMAFDSNKVAHMLEEKVEDFMIADMRNQEKSEPPAYPIEEMVDKMVKATRGSVTKDAARFLLKRNIKHSEKHPGKFYFARDNRLKHNFSPSFSQDLSIELAKRINCPYMFIKAKHSPYYEKKEYHEEVVEVLKHNKNFEYHMVDSTHHLHLTEPEKVAGLISNFICKHKRCTSPA